MVSLVFSLEDVVSMFLKGISNFESLKRFFFSPFEMIVFTCACCKAQSRAWVSEGHPLFIFSLVSCTHRFLQILSLVMILCTIDDDHNFTLRNFILKWFLISPHKRQNTFKCVHRPPLISVALCTSTSINTSFLSSVHYSPAVCEKCLKNWISVWRRWIAVKQNLQIWTGGELRSCWCD